MLKLKFSASMMCADYGHLEDEIRALEAAGVDAFHVDIMDGAFVHNFGMGLHDLRYIRSATKKSVECHLMIHEPVRYVKLFAKAGADVLYFHPESGFQIGETVHRIIDLGMTPGIVLNPTTSIESTVELLHLVKRVLIMAVIPGNAGQAFLPFIEKKLRNLIELKDEFDLEIFWDGHGSVENVRKYAPLGVDGFVLGTAALFGKERGYPEIIRELRGCTA
ncbi:MAG: ribulose-phosphate 3-epimerase [Clostridiales Family XIII bacterium]|jgi:ribulose-phosphate 3-epimerase|nr:ribulose-phosphate 3-epimerase [Clostridiales Family XIII bacterium]